MSGRISLAIIGGTGVYDLGAASTQERVPTPYGDTVLSHLMVAGQEILFLARHGAGHTVPPHRVNYRANIWALHALGIREVIGVQAVGSMHPSMAPGHFAVPAQFIDWTKCRPMTFFDGDDGLVLHADVTHPYCPRLSAALRRPSYGTSLDTSTGYSKSSGRLRDLQSGGQSAIIPLNEMRIYLSDDID